MKDFAKQPGLPFSRQGRCLLSAVAAASVVFGAAGARAQTVVEGATPFSVPGDQASPWNIAGDLRVGNAAAGTLNITGAGSAVSATGEGDLGYGAGAAGTVTVTGANASLTTGGGLYVARGNASAGALNVLAGAVVSNTGNQVFIGSGNTSTATATVDGAGSQLRSANSLGVGSGNGSQGTLQITDGGYLLVSTGGGFIGGGTGGTGEIDVQGSGSLWDSGSPIFVGNTGNGTLKVSGGGVVSTEMAATAAVGYLYIGMEAGSTGAATVTGTDSKVTTKGEVIAGVRGGGTLDILDGGVVATGAGLAPGVLAASIGSGGAASAGNGVVTVDGAGSQWVNTGDLYAGQYAQGALAITHGGAVSSGDGWVGYYTGSNGQVTVDGTGSRWTTSRDLTVGAYASGKLAVANGGAVSNDRDGWVGYSTGGNGLATVDGAGSEWTIGGKLYVGWYANGALAITGGGAVSSGDAQVGYYNTAGNTVVTVDGPGSAWSSSGEIDISAYTEGALTLSHGGAASAANGIVVSTLSPTVPGSLNIGAPLAGAATPAGPLNAPAVTLGPKGALNFNHTGAYALDAQLKSSSANSGAVTQAAGVTTLTADSSASYTGAVNVTGGTLNVQGSIASASLTAVSSAATLAGAGAVGNASLASGATLAPGDGTPGSAMTVNGNLALAPGANFVASVNASAASLATVSGAANIDGIHVTLNYSGPAPALGKTYLLIDASAGSMTGSPANSTVDLAGVIYTLTVHDQQLWAEVTALPAAPAAPASIPTLTPLMLAALGLLLAALAAWARRDKQGNLISCSFPRAEAVAER